MRLSQFYHNMNNFNTYTDLQKHKFTIIHTYVLKELLTADRSCLKKLLEKFVAHIFMLLLAPFCVQIGKFLEAQ